MSFDSRFYWKMAQKRMPVMALLFLLCAGIGLALALKLPTTYSSTARLLIEPPQISGVPSSNANVDNSAQLEIIQQRLMVRGNLVEIADKYNVFEDRGSMSADEIVDRVRDSTEINRQAGRDQATLMSVTFYAREAKIASDVVNEYVSKILENDATLRSTIAGNNLAFHNRERDRLSTDLDLQSERILAFKSENADALPEDQEFRLARQSDVQERASRIERDIASLTQRRKNLEQVFEATGGVQSQNAQPASEEERQLRALQADLREALSVYSEENPRVKILRSRISNLEALLNEQAGLLLDTPVSENTPANQARALYELNLAEIDSQIETLRAELVQANTQLAQLGDSLARTPANQIALQALERDYANLQLQYNAAIQRGNEAQMAENVTLSRQGQQISVIEQPTVPTEPSSPNRPLIMAGSIALGLAMAAGLFVLLEVLNRTARRPVELTDALGITPLATVPFMESERDKLLRRSRMVASLLVVVIGIPAILWAIDTFYLPLDLVIDNMIDRIGLG